MSQRTEFFLFGYPISHSASPAFHHAVFQGLGLPNYTYTLHDTVHPENVNTDIKSDILTLIRSPTFGGCSVTMPIKVTMTKYVDRLGPAAQEIGSINTIYLEDVGGDSLQVVGENFDWLGVHGAIVHSLPEAQQENPTPFGLGKCGFIIGGGGTTRAAVYALSQLKLSPIYLINRDAQETQDIISNFPQYDLRPLTTPDEWTSELAETVAAGVGAIPSFEPETPDEKRVYAVAAKIFESTSGKPFLEMCYKPRHTIIYKMAEAAGWNAITGIEAMIWQGLAQQTSWVINSAASPWNGQRKELGVDVQDAAANLVRDMEDIKVPPAK